MQPIPECIRALEAYLEGSGAQVERLPLPERLLGQQHRDGIQLRSGLSPEEELPALVHELAHWLVHAGALQGAALQGPERTICEYEAEAIEVRVLGRLGLARLRASPFECIEIDPAEALLAHSCHRVSLACERICAVLGLPEQPVTHR